MSLLILGLGNLLLGDDGVGVHAAQALQREELPADVKVLDIGTAILDALPDLEQADQIIVVDAVKADLAPGSICRFNINEALQAEVIGSLHGFDITRVMALTGRSKLPETTVFGVEPAVIEWSTELSPKVNERLPELLDILRQAIKDQSSGEESMSDMY